MFTFTSLRNFFSGWFLASTSTNFTAQPGVALDSTNARIIESLATITKTVSPFAPGNNNGGLTVSRIRASTTYYIFAMMKSDVAAQFDPSNLVDICFDLSNIAPQIPPNYQYFILIGQFATNASTQITTITPINGGNVLQPANNLSDIPNPAQALANLGGMSISGNISGVLTVSNNLSDVASVSSARTNLGLGTMATQNSNNVTITGGTISGVTISGITVSGVLTVSNNLSDVASVSSSRTNLGLGTMATQNANAVAITGGTISNVTISGASTISGYLTISNNLADLASASTARTNLGLGNIATQNISAVNITGGTISNVTHIGGTISGATLSANTISNNTYSGTTNSIVGGARVTSFNIGTISGGTTTLDSGNGPLQFMTNNGASTIAAPANDGNLALYLLNGASAGAITWSGFTVGSNTGDALTTTSGNKFKAYIDRINGVSSYSIQALQ